MKHIKKYLKNKVKKLLYFFTFGLPFFFTFIYGYYILVMENRWNMKEKIKLIYRILIVIVSSVALYLNFKLFGFKEGIIYFTNLSNLICLIYFTVLIIMTIRKKVKRNDTYYIFKGMVTMAITITMFIYNILLSSNDGMGAFTNHMLECNLVHLVVPLMVILDYIIFGEKGHLKKEYPIIWSSVLILYQLFVIIYVLLGGTFMNGLTYPYFYMDIEKYGTIGVLFNLLVIYIFFVGYGTIVQIIDNKLGKRRKR